MSVRESKVNETICLKIPKQANKKVCYKKTKSDKYSFFIKLAENEQKAITGNIIEV